MAMSANKMPGARDASIPDSDQGGQPAIMAGVLTHRSLVVAVLAGRLKSVRSR
jgi:hypothetical protein